MSKTINETVQLTVFKNSPHIWTGGLGERELAHWLMGRANSILYQISRREKIEDYQKTLSDMLAGNDLNGAYECLGLSRKASDPIHPLSMESIQFDAALGCELRMLVHSSPSRAIPVPPVGYSELPDLREELAEYQKATTDLSAKASSESWYKADD